MVMLIVCYEKEGEINYFLGNGGFVGCFFDTITYHLEQGKRGSRYPILNHLYDGKVLLNEVSVLKEELHLIKKQLRAFPPKDVIWDMEELSKQPPWGDDISEEITDLSNYFTTCMGEQLFDILDQAIEDAVRLSSALDLRSDFQG